MQSRLRFQFKGQARPLVSFRFCLGLALVILTHGSVYSQSPDRPAGVLVAWGLSSRTNVRAIATNLIVSRIAAGDSLSMALKVDGTLVQWGLGNTNIAWSNAVAMAAGFVYSNAPRHSLRISTDGSIISWKNLSGASEAANVPAGLPPALAVGAGAGFSLALLTSLPPPLPPFIFAQPASRIAGVGAKVTFAVQASGTPPLRYQWKRDVTNLLAGATNSMLTLSNLHVVDSGQYSASVSNAAGGMLNQPAILTMLPVLDIAAAPVIRIYGDFGATYRVDYLLSVGPPESRATLDTFVLTNSPHRYVDLSAVGQPRRFYRAVQLP